MNILIIDELNNLRELLFDKEFELTKKIKFVNSYLRGEKLLKLNKYNAIVLSLNMLEIISLENCKKIKRQFPNLKIILVSVNDDYTFNSVAIKYGVDEYILLKDFSNEIKQIIHNFEMMDSKESTILLNQNFFLQQDFLYDLIRGEYFDEYDLNTNLIRLGIPLVSEENIKLIGINIDTEHLKSLNNREKIINEVNKIFSRMYSNRQLKHAHVVWEKRSIIWFIQSEENNEVWSADLFYELEQLQKMLENRFKCKMFISVLQESIPWENLSLIFKTFKNKLLWEATEQEFEILDLIKYVANESTAEENYQRFDTVAQLSNYLDCSNQDKFNQVINEQLTYLLLDKPSEYTLQLELYHLICAKILSYLNYSHLIESFLAEFGNLEMFELSKSVWEDSLVSYFQTFSQWIFTFKREEQQVRNEKMIGSLHEYINKNLEKDLSLQVLADLVFLNPVYLSRTYKQITGKNISEYINQKKIKKACELLGNRELKISEIGLAIGYDSPAHFSRTFKKSMGMTPIQYRDYLTLILE